MFEYIGGFSYWWTKVFKCHSCMLFFCMCVAWYRILFCAYDLLFSCAIIESG
jgi:hypothetical protein